MVFAEDVATAVAAVLARGCGGGAGSWPEGAGGGRGVSLHICQREAVSWRRLVAGLADALRNQGVSVPPPTFDPEASTRFLSVDFGHLDGGAAERALPGWAAAPLAQRLQETAAWWVGRQRESFEEKAAAAAAAGKRKSRT